jgi:hypothetical protein
VHTPPKGAPAASGWVLRCVQPPSSAECRTFGLQQLLHRRQAPKPSNFHAAPRTRPLSFYLKADPDDLTRMELPLECPGPAGPRGPCTGTNFVPVEGDDADGGRKAFTNMQVRRGGCV